MHKIPLRPIGTVCALLVLLVVGRCAVTVGRALYYGNANWPALLRADPWFYVGMVAAAVSAVCFTLLALRLRHNS